MHINTTILVRLIALRQFNGALATTSLFVSLTMLFEILHMSGNLLNISFPLNEPVKYSIEGDTTTDKTAYYAEYENVSAGLAFMVATLALLNMYVALPFSIPVDFDISSFYFYFSCSQLLLLMLLLSFVLGNTLS